MTKPNLRVLVADDHAVVREGVRLLLSRQSGWEVCGVAATGREAVELAASLKPDVVVIDVTMPALNGLDAARQIKRQLPRTEIVVFTAHENEELIRKAFEAGVKSFIPKAEAESYLITAIESVSRHKPFFTNKVSEALFSSILNPRQVQPVERLSAREREIVQLIAEGKSNKAVAAALGISVRTAETHRASILRKLNLDSVAGLVRYAIRNKLIEP